ncbi:potassium-transporting ATPase subunit C, partial [Escherichia sp. SP-MK]
MRGLRPALSTFIFLLLITGGVYPLLTTVLGQWWFPWQANGSLFIKFIQRQIEFNNVDDRLADIF